MPYFKLTWLDNEDAHLITEDIFKENMETAFRYASRRVLQSPHSLPKEACGFFLNWESLNDRLQEVQT
jgi:hypothetical protein